MEQLNEYSVNFSVRNFTIIHSLLFEFFIFKVDVRVNTAILICTLQGCQHSSTVRILV
jgi:hypothetical protein